LSILREEQEALASLNVSDEMGGVIRLGNQAASSQYASLKTRKVTACPGERSLVHLPRTYLHNNCLCFPLDVFR
jgi:hypothetical protein